MHSLTRLLVTAIGLFCYSACNLAIGCEAEFDIVVDDQVHQIAFDKTGQLDAGARIRVGLTSHSECYAVVLWKTSQGEVFNLVSDSAQDHFGLFLIPNTIYSLPDNGWYQLDDHSGIETIVLVTSSQPINKPDELRLLLTNQEIKSFSSLSAKSGMHVNWKTINHNVPIRLSEFRIPDKWSQVQTRQPQIDDVLIPRHSSISLFRHDQQIQQLSKLSPGLVRGLSGTLFNEAAPTVVHIYHNDGTGSGVIVDRRGLIVTNHHVVNGHSDVAVSLKTSAASEFPNTQIHIANVIRRSKIHDLALLKFREAPSSLTAMPLGDIDDVQMGMTVHAIGHPDGLLWSYTQGIVSQIRSNYVWNNRMADIIQTQTPINPGNSGGPLFNDNGHLIGINAATRGGGTVGLNIAISVNHVKELLGKYVSPPSSPSFLPLSIRNSAFKSADRNKNGVRDIFCFDRNKNKFVDICAIDNDENGEADYWVLDQNENGEPDGRVYKMRGKGTIYRFDYDYNEDGEFDLTGYDFDADGEVDTYTRYSN